MRRKDREMDIEFAMEIIDKSSYGLVSMIDEDGDPYGIPLSIVRDGNSLYFHSARDGKKVRIFGKNPHVSLVFVGQVEIPEIYTEDELEEIMEDKSKGDLLISNVFTTEYESAIVKGKVKLVEDEDQRINAMRLICKKYTPSKMDFFNMGIRAGLKATNVYKIEIEEIKGKRKKYDRDGKEMKWGRRVLADYHYPERRKRNNKT